MSKRAKKKQPKSPKTKRKAPVPAPSVPTPVAAAAAVPTIEVDTRQNLTVKRGAFLAAFALVGNISDAAKNAGVARQTHYEWMNDPEYRLAYREARAQAADGLEREARRRAMVGVEEPVFYRGKIVGHVRKLSDRLLQMLLRAYRPRRFRENIKTEHSGGVSLNHTVNPADLEALRHELLGNHEKLAELRRRAMAESAGNSAESGAIAAQSTGLDALVNTTMNPAHDRDGNGV